MTQQETILHFAAPAPGDVFHEMYVYWLVVVGRPAQPDRVHL